MYRNSSSWGRDDTGVVDFTLLKKIKEQHLTKKRARIQSVSLVFAAAMLASLLYWLINA